MRHLPLLLMLVACKTSSSDDWVPDDIDENETLDRIGAAGYAKLCSSFEDYVRDMYRGDLLIRAACTAHALESTLDAVACGEAVDACLDDLPPAVESTLEQILDQASCPADVAQAGCQSKVSMLTTCLDDLGRKVDQIEFSLTCAAVGSPVPANWWRITPPSSCTSLGQEC